LRFVIGLILVMLVLALGCLLLVQFLRLGPVPLTRVFGSHSGLSTGWTGYASTRAWFPTFVAPVVLLGFLFCLVVLAWCLLRPGASRDRDRLSAEESRLMQEVYHGLSRLEERVEALETILMDRTTEAPRERETRGRSQP